MKVHHYALRLALSIAGAMSPLLAVHTAAAAGAASAGPERRGTEFGFAVFQQHCMTCHGSPEFGRAPSPAALRAMTPERIYAALTTGVMKSVGDTLTEEDRRRVAESVAGQLLGSSQSGDSSSMPNRCAANPPLRGLGGAAWNGWGNGLENHRFQPAASAGLTAATVPGLKLKWAFGYPGGTSAFGQPAVVAGRVFVGTDIGYVYSLDASTGCVYWSYRAQAGVRNAMTLGKITQNGGQRSAIFFGDLKANTYAIDAQSGHEIWKTRVEDHFAARVTAAPALYQGRLYVPISAWEGFQARVLDYPCCTAVGSVSALDANTGAVLWKTYTIDQRPQPTQKNSKGVQQWAPAGAPVWNTPTIDSPRHALYVGTGDASTYPAPPTTDAILALDLETGKLRWAHQVYRDDSFIVGCGGDGLTENCPKVVGPDWDIPMSPMLSTARHGRSLIIFGTKPGDILALDADRQGEVVWRVNPEDDAPLGDSPVDANTGTRGPVWGAALDDHNAYTGSSAGGVAAVRIADGQRVWFTRLNSSAEHKVTHPAAVTAIPGVLFAAGTDGRLWALSSADGHSLWNFETAREFDTVNAVPAHGGSIDSAGPTVAAGMLFVGSGYGVVLDTPGNVLLAFGLDR
ncbi:MAG: PQQ-binding-like beta-propeller repeat protein [Steroidobacteraceae bacterium]